MTHRRTMLAALLVSVAAAGAKPKPAELLKQYLAQLQKTPDDEALRSQIVVLASAMRPPPRIPDEARRPFVKATTFQKEAKDATGLELAIASYREALLLAPWWPDALYDASTAYEAAGRYDEAARTVKLFLLTRPSKRDGDEAQNRLYALEAKQEMARSQAAADAARSSEEERARRQRDAADAEAEARRRAEEERRRKDRDVTEALAGKWRILLPLASGRRLLNECAYYRFDVDGDDIIVTIVNTPQANPATCRTQGTAKFMQLRVDGDRVTGTFHDQPGWELIGGTIAPDRMSVSIRFNNPWVKNASTDYYREGGPYPIRRPGEY